MMDEEDSMLHTIQSAFPSLVAMEHARIAQFDILSLRKIPGIPQRRTGGRIVGGIMAGRSDRDGSDQTTTNSGVERGPRGRRGPAAVTGQATALRTLGALCGGERDQSGQRP